jgi:hypothetical protein
LGIACVVLIPFLLFVGFANKANKCGLLLSGYFLSCVSPNVEIGLGIAPVVLIPFLLFGGFFLNSV